MINVSPPRPRSYLFEGKLPVFDKPGYMAGVTADENKNGKKVK